VLTELPFAVPPYSSDIPGIGGDDAINIRPEVAGSGAKAQRMFVHTPALRLFCVESTAAACRGLYTASNGRVFQVAGASVWEILANGTRTIRGSVGSSTGPVGISDNGDDLVILDGVSGYRLTFVDGVFQEIDDPEFPSGAVHLAYIDGYFLCLEPNTVYIRWSALRDASSWPALNRAAAEASPDIARAVVANGRELWVLGPASTQVFYDSGNPDQEWAPVQSVALDMGTDAPHSLAVARDSVFFLGSGKDGAARVFRSSGYQIAPVSTPGIEGILSAAGDLSGALGRVHSFGGHTYYVLTVATAERTIVFDVDLGEWHERAWMNPDTGELRRWRGTHSAFGHGRMLVGDSNGNAVYFLTDSVYFDEKPDGSGDWAIKRRRTLPHYQDGGRMVQYLSAELWGRAGTAPVSGQGANPVAMLTWSNDGGRTWSSGRDILIGRLGEYGHRARTLLLGTARDRVFRFDVTDPVPVAWCGFRADVQTLPG
jgi:hypothetical protein